MKKFNQKIDAVVQGYVFYNSKQDLIDALSPIGTKTKLIHAINVVWSLAALILSVTFLGLIFNLLSYWVTNGEEVLIPYGALLIMFVFGCILSIIAYPIYSNVERSAINQISSKFSAVPTTILMAMLTDIDPWFSSANFDDLEKIKKLAQVNDSFRQKIKQIIEKRNSEILKLDLLLLKMYGNWRARLKMS